MKTKQKHTVLLTGVIAVLILALCLGLLQELLRPKYGQLNIPEGTLIADYYDDPTRHDVIFIGDCEVYENFSPVTLWEEQGITSFIRGSAQQLIWQSYYLLEETLRYETPEVVVFNVLSMKYGEPQSEAYNRLNLDGMRWSASKLGAILHDRGGGFPQLRVSSPALPQPLERAERGGRNRHVPAGERVPRGLFDARGREGGGDGAGGTAPGGLPV